MRLFALSLFILALSAGCAQTAAAPSKVSTSSTSSSPLPYTIVATGQNKCYDNQSEIASPKPGQPFYGQDAQYRGAQPSYKDNGDGTVSDLNTGLTWVKARGQKMTWEDAIAGAAACRVGGHSDWRMPTIKELYSLINFNGGCAGTVANSRPYLDTKYFDFAYGDESQGVRIIDCQDWSATQYIGKTMSGNPTVFGVNFADGRIKGYPKSFPNGRVAQMYARYVRGNPAYGKNDFQDNGDGTITDRATGLMWQKADSGKGLNWEEALACAANLKLAGHSDWRLPNAKELQSIVDYTRAPSVTQSAAISPLFQVTKLSDGDYPFFWSSTSHLDGPPDRQGSAAIYVAFGSATGWMQGPRLGGAGQGPMPGFGQQPSGGAGGYQLMDVHGAGAQRSDPKNGDPQNFPHGRGPQGDVIRIYNYVRCLRGGDVALSTQTTSAAPAAPAATGRGGLGGPVFGPGGGGPGGQGGLGGPGGQGMQGERRRGPGVGPSGGGPGANAPGGFGPGGQGGPGAGRRGPGGGGPGSGPGGGGPDGAAPGGFGPGGNNPGVAGTGSGLIAPAAVGISQTQTKTQSETQRPSLQYRIVGTGLTKCYDSRSEITSPKPGQPFYGQDAQYQSLKPAYKDNGDGTVSDLNTGLMWIKKPPADKCSWTDAAKVAASLNAQNFAGHNDWRLPNAKELYSIINHGKGWPYIDTKFFICEMAPQVEDQVKNTQYWTSDKSAPVGGRAEAFGVNFATGHIKAYASGMGSYVRCVRGNPDYGRNDFIDNKDKTITDRATGLMWTQQDSAKGMNWEEALATVQTKNKENFLGHNDWRLPNVKEMQSILD
ncbi:MAG: DUF1566 domain-containing protein, partial [Candidatus Sumerlaeota bacterium]|nr:DUF1566 domain-containing protein [Candidatus Sumerlaeota bacterium]